MLANTKQLLKHAQHHHYALGHFNINNLEIAQGVVQAAVNLRSPVILATSEGAIDYAGLHFLYAIAKTASELTNIPIALHLDHGRNLDLIRQAIKIGYSSVMIDASHETFERNIALTRKVVQLAHVKGISVEAELGTIGGVEDTVSSRHILYTDPVMAQQFVKRTGCDFLAVAIGTSHGAYKFTGQARLRHDILRQIQQKVSIPLVLHGASSVPPGIIRQARQYGAELSGMEGVPPRQLQQAISNGICKINTDTDLRLAFDAAVRKIIQTRPQDFDPRHLLGPARDLIQKVVETHLKLFGSAGRT